MHPRSKVKSIGQSAQGKQILPLLSPYAVHVTEKADFVECDQRSECAATGCHQPTWQEACSCDWRNNGAEPSGKALRSPSSVKIVPYPACERKELSRPAELYTSQAPSSEKKVSTQTLLSDNHKSEERAKPSGRAFHFAIPVYCPAKKKTNDGGAKPSGRAFNFSITE